QAMEDDSIKAIVLICEGRTFIAGADLVAIGAKSSGASLSDAQSVIENSTIPVIAAIHGTALGGGLEVALTCHNRIAVPSAMCGLPEVKLGLLPGAGGTQRLPRIVGVEKALQFLISGEQIEAPTCVEMGLLDKLAEEGHLLRDAVAFAQQLVSENKPLQRVRDLTDKIEADKGKPEIFSAFRKSIARKTRGFLAPELIVQCVEAAVNNSFDDGIKEEGRLFAIVLKSKESAAQLYQFFAERECWKIPDVPKDTPTIPVKKVGIVGAGTMGGGIAMNFANVGYDVTIIDSKAEALDRGLGVIRGNYERSAKNGRFTKEEVETRMALITGSLDLTDLADCDMVIEAVFENMKIKKEIFTNLDKIVKQGAILATNTSGLNIDEIASVTSRPEFVIGLHFFSPANVMRLVEVVRADKTSKEVINTSMKISKQIGKMAGLVGVCPGFVGNRMLGQRQREANNLVLEGAMPWDVDKVLFDFGFPMGPFAMSDLAGLDIGWNKEKSNGETIRDVLCEMDRRGQKTGAGYYDYDKNRVASPSPVVKEALTQFVEKSGVKKREYSNEDLLTRCIYPMINEGAKLLEEGKAIRSSDIDIIWVNGYGWPAYRGGPMFYADQLGLDKVLSKMKEFEAEFGHTFKPAALLEELVAEGKKFKDVLVKG
ncbi:MAG: enoyl-CoA hydratase/isomerase family protein, partial [Pseudomonadales bacterium]|nr:enoyl-CoA hydratase/isomerase family protein [Pseudomonadales bacterium]